MSPTKLVALATVTRLSDVLCFINLSSDTRLSRPISSFKITSNWGSSLLCDGRDSTCNSVPLQCWFKRVNCLTHESKFYETRGFTWIVLNVRDSVTSSSRIRIIIATKSLPFSPTVKASSGKTSSSCDVEFSVLAIKFFLGGESVWNLSDDYFWTYRERVNFREVNFLDSVCSLLFRNVRRPPETDVFRHIRSMAINDAYIRLVNLLARSHWKIGHTR